jgi:hypothetical protein
MKYQAASRVQKFEDELQAFVATGECKTWEQVFSSEIFKKLSADNQFRAKMISRAKRNKASRANKMLTSGIYFFLSFY